MFVAGVAAGAINTLVGSGTLVTFPVLLSVGYAPVVANVSNNIGLVPGAFTGAIGYRRELEGQRGRALRLGSMSALGGLAGAIALLVLPPGAFKAIVPAFIVIALVLIVLQPRLNARMEARRAAAGPAAGPAVRPQGEGLATRAAVFATGIYGGYFGAAQGIMLLGFLGVALPDDLQRVNALKNVLAGTVNLVASIVFVLVADVAWLPAGLIAAGSVAGGVLGARYGRRLPPAALRAVVVAVGLFALVRVVTS
ncbi:MAG: uncharacterized protein QOJ07_3677 [Thermoleophilaceae bacterium]|nr:uncharacterized protein [Thermoleophilaceae bacterium]